MVRCDWGRALRVCRAARGLSQKDVAAAARIDTSYLSLVECGKRVPTVSTLEEIAAALGVTMVVLTVLASAPEDVPQELAQRAVKWLAEENVQTCPC